MLRILDTAFQRDQVFSRRELLRVGGLSSLGLTLPTLLKAQAGASGRSPDSSFGRARNCIFLWLQGGPPQHETFDPKPDAPAEIRGEFRPIATNVPGIFFSELLPRTATIADKLAVVRSICTNNDLHDASGYWVLTGYKYDGTESRKISPTDWPYFGSIVKMLKPSESMPALTSVWLPDVMRLNDNVQPAGQTGGFLGRRWDPERLVCDPSRPNFRIEGLALPEDVTPLRLNGRQSLLTQIESHFDQFDRGAAPLHYDRQARDAYGLLTSGAARTAFDLGREPKSLRDRYGPGKWGQCVLLARRLVEAGVRLVHVNWPREGGDNAVDNPLWDTHAQNADRLQDVLCPQFDVGFTALIEDLESRGMLDETLVVAIGEFGRTPRINANGGRDHWGHVFSFVMAGAGIRSAQVYGSSDAIGAYPRTNRLLPQDLTATIFHLLGIDHEGFFPHPTGRPIRITEGTPVWEILGSAPATNQRATPGGSLVDFPAYSEELLVNTQFQEANAFPSTKADKRRKLWRAEPILGGAGFGVKLVGQPNAAVYTDRRHVEIGLGSAGDLPQEARAILTQEVKNPRAGRYRLTVKARGGGQSQVDRETFLAQFEFRMTVFGYQDLGKDPHRVREYASLRFQPPSLDPSVTQSPEFVLETVLKSQEDGAMQLSKGVGVAVIVERKGRGSVSVESPAHLRIDGIKLEFNPRPRNDEITV